MTLAALDLFAQGLVVVLDRRTAKLLMGLLVFCMSYSHGVTGKAAIWIVCALLLPINMRITEPSGFNHESATIIFSLVIAGVSVFQ